MMKKPVANTATKTSAAAPNTQMLSVWMLAAVGPFGDSVVSSLPLLWKTSNVNAT